MRKKPESIGRKFIGCKRKIIISCKQKTNERIRFFFTFFLLFFLFVIEWKCVVCTNENQLNGKQIKMQNQNTKWMDFGDARRKWEGKNKFYDLCVSKGICSGLLWYAGEFTGNLNNTLKVFAFKVSLAWLQINIWKALFSQSFTWIHRKKN